MTKIRNSKQFKKFGFGVLNLFRISDLEFRASRKGFTLIEITIAISVFLILGAIVIISFSNLNQRKALSTSVTTVKAVLSEARSKTLAAENDTHYGVHFAETSITLFDGDSYSAGAGTNRDVNLHSSVTITDISLAGGGDDVIFERLTGETDQSGIITLASGDGSTTTITIYGTGVVE